MWQSRIGRRYPNAARQRTRARTIARRAVTLTALIAVCVGLAACASSPRASGRMAEVYAAYERADYAAAYRTAHSLADGPPAGTRDEAAYMAGLSAARLGRLQSAEQYLRRAARSGDRAMAADALAELGLLYAAAGRYQQAADAFEQAAPQLVGEARANAYFHAGAARQKLGHTSQARSNFTLARNHSGDNTLKQRVNDELATTGFTLQIGFFTDAANAQRAAQQVSARAVASRLGPPRLVPATDAQGRSGYLVQVGQFSSYASALSARNTLGAASFIVPLK